MYEGPGSNTWPPALEKGNMVNIVAFQSANTVPEQAIQNKKINTTPKYVQPILVEKHLALYPRFTPPSFAIYHVRTPKVLTSRNGRLVCCEKKARNNAAAMNIRRNTRLRREYLYRRSLDGKQREEYEKKQKLKQALQG